MPNKPAPSYSPMTGKVATFDDMAVIFPKDIILQEASTERWIDIPDEVRDMYRQWRPSPLYRARNLEKLLKTPARIYYKYEAQCTDAIKLILTSAGIINKMPD
jgi:tryptophan synthase beta chain